MYADLQWVVAASSLAITMMVDTHSARNAIPSQTRLRFCCSKRPCHSPKARYAVNLLQTTLSLLIQLTNSSLQSKSQAQLTQSYIDANAPLSARRRLPCVSMRFALRVLIT